ncbi:hypothetical protein [Paenibacillus radicis (ex Gao et al. 2016)]|uniref:hypothetical protein n=1 Tax=Paenibacillus radicis (ex Gao et al. 2016) TaxID=1737354 RepID=UPI00166B89DD|nr:hypothetical protein [Paenibacillus radicis (ex Gao et al. 2016)]
MKVFEISAGTFRLLQTNRKPTSKRIGRPIPQTCGRLLHSFLFEEDNISSRMSTMPLAKRAWAEGLRIADADLHNNDNRIALVLRISWHPYG